MIIDNKFYITVATVFDKENGISEIFYENYQWVEISYETEELILQIYPPPENKKWEFNYFEALEALNKAKNRLIKFEQINESALPFFERKEKFEISILPEAETGNMIAQITYGKNKLATIFPEKDDLMIRFHFYPEIEYWEFNCIDALETFEKAKNKLLECIELKNNE